jgi:hypothetical protein
VEQRVDHSVTAAATEAALARRERLLLGVTTLTDALAKTTTDDARWHEEVREAARTLARTIDEHVVEAEAPHGFLDQITDEAPYLSRRAEALRREHPDLKRTARQVLDDWPEGDRAAIRAHVAPLLRSAQRHRERGTELLLDAYALDLSAGD